MRSTDSSARSGLVARTIRSSGAPARSRSAGETSESVIASERPTPTSASATSRRSCWRDGEHADLAVGVGQRAPDAVEADAPRHLLHQVDLAVEVGAEGRHDRDDGVARGAVGRPSSASSSMPSGASDVPHVFVVEVGAEHRVHPAGAAGGCAPARPARGYTSHASGATCAPATSTSSSMARSALRGDASGSMPRSKRALDSLRSFSRFELRAMPMRSKYADSSRISVVASDTSDGRAAHDPGDGLRRALGVADEQVFVGERALDVVERGDGLAVVGQAHDDAAAGEARRGRTRAAAGCARAARSW